MKTISRWFYRGRRKQNEQDDKALKNFINNIYNGHDIPLKTTKENIENGLVEMIWLSGQHAANGMLVTDNGYIITCYHCVETDLNQMRIRYGDNKYKVKKICGYSKNKDLALIKINLPCKNPEAKNYKFLLGPQISISERRPVVLLCRKNKKLVIKGGFLNGAVAYSGKTKTVEYLTEQNTIQGDSGGVVLSTDSELVGIHTGAITKYSTSATLFDVLDVIEKFRIILHNQ